MADIALLVAEEYERRVKNSRKSGVGGEEIDLFSWVTLLAHRLDGSSLINKKFGDDNIVLLKWVLEPRSQIALAAINGFFSA